MLLVCLHYYHSHETTLWDVVRLPTWTVRACPEIYHKIIRRFHNLMLFPHYQVTVASVVIYNSPVYVKYRDIGLITTAAKTERTRMLYSTWSEVRRCVGKVRQILVAAYPYLNFLGRREEKQGPNYNKHGPTKHDTGRHFFPESHIFVRRNLCNTRGGMVTTQAITSMSCDATRATGSREGLVAGSWGWRETNTSFTE